jgi:hypothetical protein
LGSYVWGRFGADGVSAKPLVPYLDRRLSASTRADRRGAFATPPPDPCVGIGSNAAHAGNTACVIKVKGGPTAALIIRVLSFT